jgi:hypothetical protein
MNWSQSDYVEKEIMRHRFADKIMKYSEQKYPFQKGIVDEHYSWVINYLAVSKCPLGLIVNFGEDSLVTKRIIL